MPAAEKLSGQGEDGCRPVARSARPGEVFRAIEAAMKSVPPPAPAFLRVIDAEFSPVDVDSWNRIRKCLVQHSIASGARDEVWCLLLRSARNDWPVGAVTCAWMALPGLQRQSRRLRIRLRNQVEAEDVDSELLAAFFGRLRMLPVRGENLVGRLLGAAARDVGEALDVVPLSVRWSPVELDSVSPTRCSGHPEFVVRRAVRVGVITEDDGDLIVRTRLGGETIRDQARRRGLTEAAVTSRRRRAELVLAHSLAAEVS